MKNRHIIEQYYSIRVITNDGHIVVVDTSGWNGTVENLATVVNQMTNKNWKKIWAFKYTQNIDKLKNNGSRIVSKKRSCLKVDRIGTGSLCTKTDENLMRDGKIPHNILAFFGENQK
jgi:hypothetical protein